MFKFGNDGENDSRLGVKSLRNTHAKCVLRSAENQQQNANDGAVHHQDTTENRGDLKYDEVLR